MFYSVIETRDFLLFNQSAQALLKGYFINIYIYIYIYICIITSFVTYSEESAQYIKFRRANVITILT